MVVVNTLYNVGARDEDPEKTGFAHLFEHLMFGGSINVPEFDTPLQQSGGENNAFTSNDITNYYDVLPRQNIETALWLESDRMLSLAFTPKSLEVQRSVVIEEFKQRYLNQPYGDVWLELRPLAYTKHPYAWATIGKEISHIENATIEDVRSFYSRYYHPANAILCIAGNLELDEVKSLTQKWYGDIPAGAAINRELPEEPKQNEFRSKTIERSVPSDAFYYAFKMADRMSQDYFVTDVISDILGRDKSSRLFTILKKKLGLVSEINCYITGALDPGLLIITGKLNDGISFEQLDKNLWELLDQVKAENISGKELDRIMIKIRTSREFQEVGLLNRAMKLCVYELLGDANLINQEDKHYQDISSEDIRCVSNEILVKENCSLLRVKSVGNG
jgi:predicted Zn-dependent peptidase